MSQRVLRVRELLKREIGQIIARDFEFDALVSVNDVSAPPDLRTACVHIGIVGGKKGDGEKARIVGRLNRAHGSIQRSIAKRVVLKFTPQLRFELDDSIERGVRTLTLLQELEDQEAAAAKARGDDEGAEDAPSDA